MRIDVEFIDQNKKLFNYTKHISLPAFLKHAALSGQGQMFGVLPTIARGLGAFMFYNRYIDFDFLNFRGFRTADLNLYDPTDQGAFSTIVGKAIADFLAKNILGAKYTHSYESAMVLMDHPIVGERPDLYCTTASQQFAMEAKGFSARSVSPRDMAEHKEQSRSGPIEVNFSVASVSYNIYEKLRCKFHDPVGKDVPFYKDVNETLARLYYGRLTEELDNSLSFGELEIYGRSFRAYDLSAFFYLSPREDPIYIVVEEICTKQDNAFSFTEYNFERLDEELLYVDTDGIGILVGRHIETERKNIRRRGVFS